MSPNEHAPEWADYARERHEAMIRDVPPLPGYWNGTNWSERPDPSEYRETDR